MIGEVVVVVVVVRCWLSWCASGPVVRWCRGALEGSVATRVAY